MIKIIKIPKSKYKTPTIHYGDIWWCNGAWYHPEGSYLINFYEKWSGWVQHIYNVKISSIQGRKPVLLFKLFNRLFIYY